ncbi:hypothetical protein [Caldichromatium japonicum]|nr:hypothetical protein [Caldichromatium japonicum]
MLDVFGDLPGWSAIASGQSRLDLGLEAGPNEGPALRLDFDFGTDGGFVVARRRLSLRLPGSFALHLELSAQGQARGIEIKLVAPGDENVWLWRSESFDFQGGWHSLELNARAFAFGWGPAGGGSPDEIDAIEIALLGGGKGSLWLADLRLEDRTPPERPQIIASDGPDAPAWIELDCGAICDYSALYLTWETDGPHPFRVLARDGSDEGWRRLYESPHARGRQNAIYLADGCSRLLRIESLNDRLPLPRLLDHRLSPAADARSLEEFLMRLAETSPRGAYPRWLDREQIEWTAIDRPDGQTPAILSEDGAVEVGRAWPMIEPMLWTGEMLLTWGDCTIEQGLIETPLPIPQVIWRRAAWQLVITAFAQGEPGWLYLGYRIARQVTEENPAPAKARLYLLLRPFQVTPPWQRHREIGGLAPIHRLAWEEGGLWADGRLALVPLLQPSGVGVGSLDEGPWVERLAAGLLPQASAIDDPNGLGCAAVWFDLELAAGAEETVWLAAPLGEQAGQGLGDIAGETLALRLPHGEVPLEQAIAEWRGVLRIDVAGGTPTLLSAPARPYWDAAQGAIAHVLINRQGPALQPGPRRYARSWIRDGAAMAAALNRFGLVDVSLAFVEWYAGFQDTAGRVPCCVDDQGPDWLVEHDSLGQLIFAIADAWRFGADPARIAPLWPAVCKAVDHLERLRAERLTPEYQTPQRRACFGLLPESASHEGYLAHPVHAYWDDLWALRGLKDATELAEALGDEVQAGRCARLRAELAADLYRSIEQVAAAHGLEDLPASVELADHDPVALAVALGLVDEGHRLPQIPLRRTFERFIARFRAMHGPDPVTWTNFTPYEIRVASALIRIGWRAEAHEVLGFYLDARTPPAWNQWPEIIWRDPRAPAHRGDLPHSWIGAEYALAVRDLFVYERDSDRSLVIAAGIPLEWLQAGPIRLRGLPTAYGPLDIEIAPWTGGALVVQLGGDLSLPPGGIWVCPPLPGPLFSVRIDGEESRDVDASGARVRALPARLELLA